MRLNLLGATIVAGLLIAGAAYAQDAAPSGPQGITFPIAELGGCNSKEECKAYCDDSAHADACLAFAEKNNLMTESQVAQARKLMSQRGPGGCQGQACREYCAERKNFTECSKFAEEQGFKPRIREVRPQVQEPRINEDRAQKILQEKAGPGGCKSMQECHAYCENENNITECLTFAKENGLMSQEDAARAEKLTSQTGPGGCKGIACKQYCEDENRAQECLAFAKENGLISQEEAERAEKLMNTTGPGGCRGIECRSYCEDPSHREACFEFAKQNGLISGEELQRIEQFKSQFEGQDQGDMGRGPMSPGGVFNYEERREGPGGCKSREECEAYCKENPSACGPRGEQSEGPRGQGGPGGHPPCNSPEECEQMFKSQGQGQGQFPGAGDPRYMGNEQFREEGGSFQPPPAPGMQDQREMRPMPPFDNAQGKPFDTTQGRPEGREMMPFDNVQGKPQEFNRGEGTMPMMNSQPPPTNSQPPPPPPPPSSFLNPVQLTASIMQAFLAFFGF